MTVADTANGREEQVGGGAPTLPEVPTDRELRVAAMLPAGLAALGEAGVVFLLVELAARSTVLHPSGGPLAWYPMFLALFVGGVLLGTFLRHRGGMPAGVAAGCVAVGVIQSLVWNEGGGAGAFVAIGLCLATAIRIATLALRDWRDPIDASFGWGAGVLLGEIAFSGVAGWGDVVWPVAVLFFLGSLGSRAASVRLVERSIRGAAAGADSGRRWRIVGAAVLVGGAVLTGIGLALGTQKGPIDRLAQWLIEGLAWLMYAAAVAVAAVVSFLFSAIGIDRGGLNGALDNLRDALRGFTSNREAVAAPTWQRAVGVTLVFVVVAGLAYVAVKRRWPRAAAKVAVLFLVVGLVHLLLEQQGINGVGIFVIFLVLLYLVVRRRQHARRESEARAAWVPSVDSDEGMRAQFSEARRRRKLRNELPEDAVRRLYAQALNELEDRGRPRSANETPAEFLRTIRAGLPQCAAGMGVLTRAYEDVRYGRIDLDRTAVDSLEAEWLSLRKAIRAAPPPLPEDEAERTGDAEALATHLAERAEGAAGAAPSSDETFGRR